MKDEEIVDLYWQRDEQAITETNAKYGPYCRVVADNILHDEEDTGECINDTWFKTWNSIPPNRPDSLKLYVVKIARNLALNIYKSRNAIKRGCGEISYVFEELEMCVSGNENVEDKIITKELGEEVNQFLHMIKERECNIFIRRYFYVESVREIAQRYGVSEKNVGVILTRTRKKLKNYLKERGW